MNMRAGELDREITIERPVSTPDATYGTPTIFWVPLVTLPGSPPVPAHFWAQVVDSLPSRAESVRQGLAVARDQVRVRMRWRDDVDSSMRIIVHDDADRILQIIAGPAALDGRKHFMEMMCERFSS